MSYLIQSRLAGSLIIDDIGISLNPGESKLISDQLYNSSKKIKEYERRKWIVSQVKNSNVNFVPYQITSPSVQSVPPTPVFVPPPPPPPALVVQQPSNAELQGLVSELRNLISNLQVPRHVQTIQTLVQKPISDDPLFIPNKIVPEATDIRINVTSAESDGQNFDSGLQALKKTRKKNE